jgi:hypothetical protein
MDDEILAKIDAMLAEQERITEELRRTRRQYLTSPGLARVLASLIRGEPAPVPFHAASKGRRARVDRDASSHRAAVDKKSAKLGLTEAVLMVVNETPGLTGPDLIDRVEPIVTSKAKGTKLRRAISNTYDFLVKSERLKKIEGRFHPYEE